MANDGNSGRKRKEPEKSEDASEEHRGPRTRSKSESSALAPTVRDSSFPNIEGLPQHSLEDSRKRGRGSGIGSVTGDRRIVEDQFKDFPKRKLSGQAKQHFLSKFAQADAKKRGSFITHEIASKESGEKEHEYFGVVEPVKGVLSGRSVETPLSKGFIEDVDNSSHPLPVSAVRNQHEVNKSSLVFSENAIANQGGARVAEEIAKNKALDLGDKRVALVTRTVTPPGSDRPSQVTRAVLVRSQSANNITVVGGFGHDNDKKKA